MAQQPTLRSHSVHDLGLANVVDVLEVFDPQVLVAGPGGSVF